VKHPRRVYDATKRVLDDIVSALLLAVLSPVLLGVAVLVRIRLGSPVLFTQERPGLGGTSFTLYKFRSMREGSGSGIEAVSTDADRLSSFGRLLRASSLDELPELWNVLLGDMSLVGPRPLLTEYLPLYNETQARRHEVRPGITGWAQVNGRNAVEWDDRLRMDVHYVDNRSLALDARVLLMTVATVFARKGVSAEGHATMRPFDPNEPSDKEDS
jgi:lipopolysaccharide/colanic/teichoic acid biosynthesis glycosyltransferase